MEDDIKATGSLAEVDQITTTLHCAERRLDEKRPVSIYWQERTVASLSTADSLSLGIQG